MPRCIFTIMLVLHMVAAFAKSSPWSIQFKPYVGFSNQYYKYTKGNKLSGDGLFVISGGIGVNRKCKRAGLSLESGLYLLHNGFLLTHVPMQSIIQNPNVLNTNADVSVHALNWYIPLMVKVNFKCVNVALGAGIANTYKYYWTYITYSGYSGNLGRNRTSNYWEKPFEIGLNLSLSKDWKLTKHASLIAECRAMALQSFEHFEGAYINAEISLGVSWHRF